MPHSGLGLGCPFTIRSVFDGWLPAVPFRGEAGRLSWRRPSGPVEPYLVGTAFVAAATLVRLSVDHVVVGSQFTPYFLAAFGSTLSGGICVGLFSIALSLLSAWFFFLAPHYPGLEGSEVYSVFAFILVAVPIVYIVGLVQNAAAVIQGVRLRAAVAEERARTADELRRWKQIFDHIGVGITISDPETNTLRLANPAYAAMHGMPLDTIEGVSIFDTYVQEEHARVAELAAIVDRDGVVDFEAYHVRTDGFVFPARIHITSVPRMDGVRPYRIVTVTDITAEREIQTRLNDVFDNAAFGISIVDPESNVIRFANPAYAAAHAMSVNEIQGRSIYEMYLQAEHERIAALKVVADRDGVISYEVNHVRKDGSVFPARVHVTSVRSPDGAVRYRIATVQNIAHEQQLQAELDQAQRLEAVGQLCAGVAHDFNNLLQAIISHLELVEEDVVPEATSEKIGIAIRLAVQGGELTQQLLSFGRRQLLVPQEIDLHAFLEELARLLSRALDPRIRIEFNIAPRSMTVFADSTHLRTALLNVAINARDAMPHGGQLRLHCDYASEANTLVLLRITDTGTGIAEADLPRVCEPFFSTKGLNGSGLGLSMVHGFVKQSGGDLRILSERGKGTTVELSLPAYIGQENAAA